MIPSIGRIVHYRLNEQDVEQIKRLRMVDQDRQGNEPKAGQTYPAMIVAVWGVTPSENTSANLQVILDGNDSLWATSRGQGAEFGQWHEPPRTLADI